MKNVFEKGPDDFRLAELVAGPTGGGPSDADEALRLYGKLAMRARPVLVAIASGHRVTSPELLVDETIEQGFMWIEALLNRNEPPFRYTGENSLASWLTGVMGNPRKPRNGGLIQKYLRAERKFDRLHVSFDEKHDVINNDACGEDNEHLLAALAQQLCRLEPRERFIVEAYYGLSSDLTFSVEGIRARCELARFPADKAKTIVARARRSGIAPLSKKLTQAKIAVLLDVAVVTVARILEDARMQLLANLDRP